MRIIIFLIFLAVPAFAQEVTVFGPGGPAPAMKAAAAEFTKKTGIPVSVTAGPTDKWAADATGKGDLIFSGSENMLDNFIDKFSLQEIKALYLRPAAILVRKGNPKNIKGLTSLFQKDINVMVVQGAGQVGLWEDLVGRTEDVNNINLLRKNIKFTAKNSALALAAWKEDTSLDAWIIWNHWHLQNQDISDMVKIENKYNIYRAASIGFTSKGLQNEAAKEFYNYLDSPEAEKIFKTFGWQKKWGRRFLFF